MPSDEDTWGGDENEEFIQRYAEEPNRKTIIPMEDDLYPGVRGFRSTPVDDDVVDTSRDFDRPDGVHRPLDYYFR